MEHSIDTIKQKPDTLPLPSVTKTYRLPEGMSLGPDESVKVKGFIARARGDELKKVADIEHRAAEIGLYFRVAVQFPGDAQGAKGYILLTDAVGNQVIMPSREETTDLLKRLFGYQETEEQLFDAEAALSAMSE